MDLSPLLSALIYLALGALGGVVTSLLIHRWRARRSPIPQPRRQFLAPAPVRRRVLYAGDDLASAKATYHGEPGASVPYNPTTHFQVMAAGSSIEFYERGELRSRRALAYNVAAEN